MKKYVGDVPSPIRVVFFHIMIYRKIQIEHIHYNSECNDDTLKTSIKRDPFFFYINYSISYQK